MTSRRLVACALVAVGSVALVAGLIDLLSHDDPARLPASALRRAIGAASPAVGPFTGLTALRLEIADRCLHVVVADSAAERVEGLRGRRDLGRYDGMLFAFDGPTRAAFTMSTVPVPLDIGFYDSHGSPVSRRRMKPCADVEARCPTYASGSEFVYALETLRGRLPSGPIGACPS